MQASARHAHKRIGDTATEPPRGSGPYGAPGRKRWIGVVDVLVWNARSHSERDEFHWRAASDPIRDREYALRPLSLRDYQVDAVARCHDDDNDVFSGGVIEMGCGMGKSWIAAELIRRSRAPAIVIAQHVISVNQWVALLRTNVAQNVITLPDDRDEWTIQDPTPDVIVTTYNSLVRASRAAAEHREALASTSNEHVLYTNEFNLLFYCMCVPFGILVLDEVHVAVADAFLTSGFLRASVVFGLSGSLVREDQRIERLVTTVGPVLVSRIVQRDVTVVIVSVPVAATYRDEMEAFPARSGMGQLWRALNPFKLHALVCILKDHPEDRILVFCDVVRAVYALSTLTDVVSRGAFVLTGTTDSVARQDVLQRFSTSSSGVLLCTRVCDTSINFPIGCVVVQHHVTTASRQQEVQRCGRGTRDVSNATVCMYHILNCATMEEKYVARRVSYMKKCVGDGVRVDLRRLSLDAPIAMEHHDVIRRALL